MEELKKQITERLIDEFPGFLNLKNLKMDETEVIVIFKDNIQKIELSDIVDLMDDSYNENIIYNIGYNDFSMWTAFTIMANCNVVMKNIDLGSTDRIRFLRKEIFSLPTNEDLEIDNTKEFFEVLEDFTNETEYTLQLSKVDKRMLNNFIDASIKSKDLEELMFKKIKDLTIDELYTIFYKFIELSKIDFYEDNKENISIF